MKFALNVIALFIICSLNTNAQRTAIIQYKLTTKSDSYGVYSQNYIVYINGLQSIQLSYKNIIPTSSNEENRITDVKVISGGKPIFIFKDFKDKRLILSDHISTKQYLINDTLNWFKWKITNDYKKIQNFRCRKAITNFRGRNYIAWFTEELPIQNGPWKFCGLPGLIINVSDDNFFFSYELTGIDLKAKFDERIISLPKEYLNIKAIEHKNFMALVNKKKLDYEKFSRMYSNNVKGGISNVSISIPEKQEKF